MEDYFAKKRAELGMDRVDVLVRIQTVLDEWYPDRVRARQLHRGVLYLVTSSAAVAGALRMRQIELVEGCELGEVRVAISVGSLSK